MKLYTKIATIFAAAVLMLGSAGNAMAYFEAGKLIRVAYDATVGKEVATDLGWVNDIIANQFSPKIYGAGANSILSGVLASSNPTNVKVAYFAYNQPANDLWASSKNDAQNTLTTAWTNAKAGLTQTTGAYQAVGTQTVVFDTSFTNSYYTKLAGNGTKPGSFASLFPVGTAETNLSALAVLNLFFFDNPGTSAGRVGQLKTTIATLADGSTQVSAVPIPPAFFLMGSGLLGMIGLRRRMA